MKQVTIDKNNPFGIVSEYTNGSKDDVVVVPTPEQRLEALEAAMLELIMRGGAG